MKNFSKKIPSWAKKALVPLLIGYFAGRFSVPVHTESTTEVTTQIEQSQKEKKSKTVQESKTKITKPTVTTRTVTKPDGTVIEEKIEEGGSKEKTKKKEKDKTKSKSNLKSSESKKEKTVTEPFPTWSVGAKISAPVTDITGNHLNKELDITIGYRIYKSFWLEAAASSPVTFSNPSVGIGFRVEF